jgi:hypothetical protein
MSPAVRAAKWIATLRKDMAQFILVVFRNPSDEDPFDDPGQSAYDDRVAG